MTRENKTLTHALFTLEQRLLDPAFRKNRAAVAHLLAAAFREFGKSGRAYTKEEILDLLAGEEPQTITIEDFSTASLAEDVALVTYTSVSGEVRARRSSVWVWRDGRWQMCFHQGTLLPSPG